MRCSPRCRPSSPPAELPRNIRGTLVCGSLMAYAVPTHHDLDRSTDTERVRHALARARVYYEDPSGALAEAIRCYEFARSLEDTALCARARAIQGAVSLHRGDL